MAKKDNPTSGTESLDDKDYQAAIEEKVRQMLDPEIKDPEPETEANPTTAPEVGSVDLPEKASESESPIVSDAEPAVEAEPAAPTEPDDDQAVDDIVAEESDKLLEHEDEDLAKAFDNKKPSRFQRFRQGWKDWWHNPVKRRLSLAGLLLALVALFATPTSRYFVLNSAGVRSSASMVILDNSTQQPLKNVTVGLGTQTGSTDENGKVTFTKIRLGKQSLSIHKRAFADLSKSVTIGWGSNPLGELRISPAGSQYTFEVKDYLSGKPMAKVEAVAGEFNAQSSDEGLIKLTVDSIDELQTVDVVVKAEGYREETVTLDLDSQETTTLEMVPAQKHYFVSKRSGRYDIYKIDADGKNESKVLSGSGTEREDLVLVPHPTNGYLAMVSTRENVRNKSGFLLSTLTVIEPEQNTPSKVAQSEQLQIVDWVKDRLVFVQITEGASAGNPKRQRLMSYDLKTGQTTELATANYFNDVISINGTIFYTPSSVSAPEPVGLYKISADGSGKQRVMNEEVWNIFRTDYDKLVLASGANWYDYQIVGNKSTKLSGEPANLSSRIYIPSPNGQQELWVDNRDGKGVLLSLNAATKEDKILVEKSGLQNPVRWLNDTALVFRVSNGQETADYVMSTDGGEPRKLKDVTNTSGIDRWYYY